MDPQRLPQPRTLRLRRALSGRASVNIWLENQGPLYYRLLQIPHFYGCSGPRQRQQWSNPQDTVLNLAVCHFGSSLKSDRHQDHHKFLKSERKSEIRSYITGTGKPPMSPRSLGTMLFLARGTKRREKGKPRWETEGQYIQVSNFVISSYNVPMFW